MKLLTIFALVPFLFGFKFTPMSQSIELGDKQYGTQFLLENDSSEDLPIELTVRERVMDDQGQEELPKNPHMSIYPPQMIIPAKQKRTVRVTWNGDKKLKVEKAFRVIAEQLPLKNADKSKRKTGIKMLMKYMAALYVTPEGATPSLKGTVISSGPNKLILSIKNEGSRHQILTEPTLTFKRNDKRWQLEGDALKGLTGENVLAESERVFTLNTKENIPKDATITLKVDD